MSTAEATELTDILNRVTTWPTTLRITLARKILETVDTGGSASGAAGPEDGGSSAAESEPCSRQTGPRR